MLRPIAAVLLSCAAVAACSPTFNWREVRVESTALKVLLPCKPDKGSRRVAMGGRDVELFVVGCATGGATFAVLHADLGEAARSDAVLEQWNRATLATMKGTPGPAHPFLPPGATPLPGSVRVSARGQRPDGSPVRGEAAYFAHGAQVFQAVIYADEPRPEWVQPFFEGLKFE